MKSSAISLAYKPLSPSIPLPRATNDPDGPPVSDKYLVHLIDSPGHVDFTSEVSAALRVCDGCVVLVDVVEGVCVQTHVVLRQAWDERVRPTLVLNKMDRLITELQMDPTEAARHVTSILEQLNALISTFHTSDLMAKKAAEFDAAKEAQRMRARRESAKDGDDVDDVTLEFADWGIEEVDDEDLFFSPERGNVVFASAADGWGFRTEQFAELYSKKMKIKQEVLSKTMWGEWYIHAKTKRIVKKPPSVRSKTLFVQLVLETLYRVYNAVLENHNEELDKIMQTLSIKIPSRDLKHKDRRVTLQSVMGRWLPLSEAVLAMVVEQVPSPVQAQSERMSMLWPHLQNKTEAEYTELERRVLACDDGDDAPVAVFISKMSAVPRSALPINRRAASVVKPRTRAPDAVPRPNRAEEQQAAVGNDNTTGDKTEDPAQPGSTPAAEQEEPGTPAEEEPVERDPNEEVLIAFARVFSGTLRPGIKVHVFGPKYDPAVPDKHHYIIDINELYLLMGRDLESLSRVSAGNVCGLGGLDSIVLKTATLSSAPDMYPFNRMAFVGAPLVKVAIEPYNPSKLPMLVKGLQLLNLCDPMVQVILQESGEHVLAASGEVHLQVLLKDLRERFAKIPIQVSDPIVSFRETVLCGSGAASGDGVSVAPRPAPTEARTANQLISVAVTAITVPDALTQYLERNQEKLRALFSEENRLAPSSVSPSDNSGSTGSQSAQDLHADLVRICKEAGGPWPGYLQHLWALGPRRCGPNLLVCDVPELVSSSVWSPLFAALVPGSHPSPSPGEPDEHDAILATLERSIRVGFQAATQAGPLCEEPMSGVAFIISAVDVSPELDVNQSSDQYGPISGQIISAVKDGCRDAFKAASPRLREAMYACNLQAAAEVLGKVYGVISKRRGKVVSEDMREGTSIFDISCHLPVAESFGFADEIRKRSSGAAIPQLVFSHWEVMTQDPYFTPTTEEELEEFGDTDFGPNLARDIIKSVRKRKGLFVEEKIVEHAEKQRTLKRNK
eukprot:TRINITY_DN41018_c0_g1_i1.p1 TRINITY_DN41018_c0_g1~~TRINITY_DN41018_c0_g1_i1.p1  ORF type:complete len:1148 (-),score=244.21 TRINITY_DN41018_c0_g1_i1:11-3049(-)